MTKDIVNGIAITSIIVAISIYMPIIGFFFVPFVPLPTLFYRAKLGRNTGAVIPIATIMLMAIVGDGLSIDIFILIELLILGFSLGELFEINVSIEKTVIYTCGIVLLTTTISLFFYSSLSNYGMSSLISEYVAKNLEFTLSRYKEMGMPEETIHMIDSSMAQIQYVLVRIIPALVIASTLLVAWMNLLMAKSIFLKKGLRYPDFGPLNRWKSPEFLVWGVIVTGIMVIIPNRAIKIIGINCLLIALVIYFFQGIAIVTFFFEKKQLPKGLRIFLYSLIGIQQILLFFIIGLGFFDVWLDVRKLSSNEKTLP